MRRIEQVAPVAITTSPSGRTIVDFGQNLVGWLRLTVQGPAGQTITLRHAEVLEDGELGTRPLRHARGHRPLHPARRRAWRPGSRASPSTASATPRSTAGRASCSADDLRAVVCHSDMERTGWFECSDPLINRLHENVVWSMRGNFLDIPTDCPQRDERLGWTGDIQVFAPTACFLYDSAGFLQSWLADLAAEQRDAGGVVPFVVPNVMHRAAHPGGRLGRRGRDRAVGAVPALRRRGHPGRAVRQHARLGRPRSPAWPASAACGTRGFQFGDWLDPTAPPDQPGGGAHQPAPGRHRLLRPLGRAARPGRRRARPDRGRRRATARWPPRCARPSTASTSRRTGALLSDATTGYALALEFALLPDAEQRRHAGARLAALVRDSGYRISTGFVGTPLICDALCSVGAYDAAFRLLLQRECPSWLYPVTMGATTIWERWDSMLPDGSVNPGEMTSFNHYALGAVADWLHRTVGGLAPAAPGYRRLDDPAAARRRADPRARAAPHALRHGRVRAGRSRTGRSTVEVVVPPNTTASVTLPGGDAEPIEVGAGTHRWSYPYQVPQVARHPLSIDWSLLGAVLRSCFRHAVSLRHRSGAVSLPAFWYAGMLLAVSCTTFGFVMILFLILELQGVGSASGGACRPTCLMWPFKRRAMGES